MPSRLHFFVCMIRLKVVKDGDTLRPGVYNPFVGETIGEEKPFQKERNYEQMRGAVMQWLRTRLLEWLCEPDRPEELQALVPELKNISEEQILLEEKILLTNEVPFRYVFWIGFEIRGVLRGALDCMADYHRPGDGEVIPKLLVGNISPLQSSFYPVKHNDKTDKG